MDPLHAVLIGTDMFGFQVIHVREGQSRQAAEREHVADASQPFVRQRLFEQGIQLRFRQVVFGLVVLLLEFVVTERILFQPFVTQAVEREVLHAIQQIDRPVVVAAMRRLQKRIEPVEKLVVDRTKRNVLLAVTLPNVFRQVTQYPVVLVRRELRDPDANLALTLPAILFQLGKKRPSV